MCLDHTHCVLCARRLPLCWPRLCPPCALRLTEVPYGPTPA